MTNFWRRLCLPDISPELLLNGWKSGCLKGLEISYGLKETIATLRGIGGKTSESPSQSIFVHGSRSDSKDLRDILRRKGAVNQMYIPETSTSMSRSSTLRAKLILLVRWYCGGGV